MNPILDFDPIASPSGTIDTHGINSNEQVMLYNATLACLQLEFPDKTVDILPPSWAKDWIKSSPIGKIKYTTLFVLPMNGQPVSKLFGTLYESGEHTASINSPIQYVYVIGNLGGITATSLLINTGNPVLTEVIKAVDISQSPNSTYIDFVGAQLTLGDYHAGGQTGKIVLNESGSGIFGTTLLFPGQLYLNNIHADGTFALQIVDSIAGNVFIISTVTEANKTRIDIGNATYEAHLRMFQTVPNGGTFIDIVSGIISANAGNPAIQDVLLKGKSILEPQAVQTIGNNGTISYTGHAIHVKSTAAVTGVIMGVGSIDGQQCILLNDGSFSLTFAAAGSNVGSGSNNVLNSGRNMIMYWNANTNQWQNHGGT